MENANKNNKNVISDDQHQKSTPTVSLHVNYLWLLGPDEDPLWIEMLSESNKQVCIFISVQVLA